MWTPEQTAYLIDHYAMLGPGKLIPYVGHSLTAITVKLRELREEATATGDIELHDRLLHSPTLRQMGIVDGYVDVPWQGRITQRDQHFGIIEGETGF